MAKYCERCGRYMSRAIEVVTPEGVQIICLDCDTGADLSDWREYLRFQGAMSRAKRKLIKRRGAKCQHCGRLPARFHLHHIVHQTHGGTNDYDNLLLLCRDCHSFEHNHGVGR